MPNRHGHGKALVTIVAFSLTALFMMGGALQLAVSGNETGMGGGRYTPPAMGRWAMLTGGGWPENISTANCNIMSRDDGREYVIFNRAVSGGNSWFEVWSFFTENETWYRWNFTGPAPSASHSNQAFTSSPDGEMGFYYGGWSQWSSYWDKVNVFFYSNKTWVQFDTPTTLGGRYWSGMTYDPSSGSVWIFGGRNQAGTRLSDLHRFDLTNGWSNPTPAVSPPVRDQPDMTISPDGKHIFITLGRYQSQPSRYRNDLWVYNVSSIGWSELNSALGIPTQAGSLFQYRSMTNDLILSMGFNGNTLLNDTYVISPQNGSVTRVYIKDGMPARHVQAWDLMQDGTSALFLGSDAGAKDIWVLNIYTYASKLGPGNPVWAGGSAFTGYEPEDEGKLMVLKFISGTYWQLAHFSLSDRKWYNSSVSTTNAPTYHDGMAFVYEPVGNDFYLYGGYYRYQVSQWTYHYYFFDEFWKLNVDSGEWTRINLHAYPGPRGRADMTIDPANGLIFLFGGQIPGGDTNKLHMYNIIGNIWSDITPQTSPSGRMQTSLCFDEAGKGFYMFGGTNNGTTGDENDMWFFHTDTGKWEQMTGAQNPPSARYDTGLSVNTDTDEVLVFGENEGQNPPAYPPDYFIWRPGWLSWESHQSDNGLHNWYGHGQVYSEATGSHYLWAGSGTEVWEYRPILRTTSVYIELLSPKGQAIGSAFPTAGTYSLHCRGRSDMPPSDLLGFDLSVKMGEDSYGVVWMRDGPLTESGNMSWMDLKGIPEVTFGPGDRWDVNFRVDFLFGTPHRTSADVTVMPITGTALREKGTKLKAFTVYSDLIVTEYHFHTPLQGSVVTGDWLWGRTELTVDTFSVAFEGAPDVSPIKEGLTVELSSSKGQRGTWYYVFNTTGSITLPIIGDDREWVTYRLNLTEGDITLHSVEFDFRLDLDPPSAVIGPTLRADSLTDATERMDNDRDDIYLTWDGVIENGAGLKGICFSLDSNTYPSEQYMTNVPLNIHEKVVGHIQEGFHTLYVWAVDNESRVGPWSEIPFVIDTHMVTITELSPDPAVLVNTTSTTYNFVLVISDPLSGVDLSSVEYTQSMPNRQYSPWKRFDVGTGNASSVLINATLELVPGIMNLVMFRAKDMADNLLGVSRAFQVNCFPGLTIPSATLLAPVNGGTVNKDVHFSWEGEYFNMSKLSYELHMIDPKGQEHIRELTETSVTLRVRMPGEYTWFVVAMAEGISNRSLERNFHFDPPFAQITPPSSVEVVRGKEVAVEIELANGLEASVNLTMTLPEPKGFRIKEGNTAYLPALEQKKVYLVLNSSSAQEGSYTMRLQVSDDFGRSVALNLSMVVTGLPQTEDGEDGEEEGIPLWALILAAILVIAIIVIVALFVLRKKEKVVEDEDETEQEDREPDLHYDPKGKVAMGGTGSKHTVQLTPGLHTGEEELRRMGSNVIEMTLPPREPALIHMPIAPVPSLEKEEEEDILIFSCKCGNTINITSRKRPLKFVCDKCGRKGTVREESQGEEEETEEEIEELEELEE